MCSKAPRMLALAGGRRGRERLLRWRRGERRIRRNIITYRPGIDFDRRDAGGQAGSEHAGTPKARPRENAPVAKIVGPFGRSPRLVSFLAILGRTVAAVMLANVRAQIGGRR